MSIDYQSHGHPPGWENEFDPRCQACAKNEFAAPGGWATAQATALQSWMMEVTQLLCYQPEVPMTHKEDLCAALNRYNEITAQVNRR